MIHYKSNICTARHTMYSGIIQSGLLLTHEHRPVNIVSSCSLFARPGPRQQIQITPGERGRSYNYEKDQEPQDPPHAKLAIPYTLSRFLLLTFYL